MAVRFDEEDVRSMGRPAYGVRGMKLAEKDYIVGMVVTPKNATPGGRAQDAQEESHRTRAANDAEPDSDGL